MDDEIEAILKDYDIEIVLDMCDMTAFEALKILVDGGHLELPSWVPKW